MLLFFFKQNAIYYHKTNETKNRIYHVPITTNNANILTKCLTKQSLKNKAINLTNQNGINNKQEKHFFLKINDCAIN